MFSADNILKFVFNNLLGPCLQHYEGTGQQTLAISTQLFNDLEDLLQQVHNKQGKLIVLWRQSSMNLDYYRFPSHILYYCLSPIHVSIPILS